MRPLNIDLDFLNIKIKKNVGIKHNICQVDIQIDGDWMPLEILLINF